MFGRYVLAALAPILLSSCVAAQTPVPQTTPDPFEAWTEACEDWDDWDKPAPPFRIHGSTYYVGTCGIGAILIADPEGHILIDSGTETGAQVVLGNIRSSGYDAEEAIALVLFSHEHFDHVGGHGVIQSIAPGATFVSSPTAETVFTNGENHADDPQFGMHDPMAPVRINQVVHGGETLHTQHQTITAIETPGHTPGAMTWYWESCEHGGECLTIVYADSLSAVSSDEYRFSDHPEYVQAFRDGIARLAELDCDILLTPHPSASGMRDKLLADDLTSGMDCADYAADRLERLEARLAREAQDIVE